MDFFCRFVHEENSTCQQDEFFAAEANRANGEELFLQRNDPANGEE